MRRPDFIIIGAMKCATSTLHDQLASQTGVFMTTPKEPNFFSDDAPYARGSEWYASLFAAAPRGALCGESSTHYTKRPTHPNTVERMKRHFGDDVRLVYVMRHPIDRLISQYIHEWTQNAIRVGIERAVVEQPELTDYSRYWMQIEPYLEAFGAERVLPAFFERLRARPQPEFERIAQHIGFNGQAMWQPGIVPRNVSSQRLRKSMWRDAIVNLPGAATLRRTLVPRRVRDRLKRAWTMEERPVLKDATVRRLEDVFDAQFERLSAWVGTRFTCATYEQAVCGHDSAAVRQGEAA